MGNGAQPIVYNTQLNEYFDPLIAKAPEDIPTKEKQALFRLINDCIRQIVCYLTDALDFLPDTAEANEIKSILTNHVNRRTTYSPRFIKLVSIVATDSKFHNRDEVLYLVREVKEAADFVLLISLRLVKRLVGLMVSKSIGSVDEALLAEAVWAALWATYSYDPSRGIAFSTFVAWWVKSMVGALLDKKKHASVLPKPDWFSRMNVVFGRTTYKRLYSLGRQPTAEDFEKVTGVWPGSFFTSLSEEVSTVSLQDKLVVSEDELEQVVGEEEDYEGMLDRDKILMLLSKLPELERQVVETYFGFDGNGEKAFAAVARKLKISKSLAHKLFQQALTRLRKELVGGNTKNDQAGRGKGVSIFVKLPDGSRRRLTSIPGP